MADPTNNSISVSTPGSILGGIAGGGFNLNYDFGANAPTIANSAYSFLNGVFNNNTAFLGGQIASTQNFVGNLVQPVVTAASNQMAANTQQIPSIFASLFSLGQSAQAANTSITNTGIMAQQNIAIAAMQSAASSAQAASNSGGGGCFITTAVCDSLDLPDDNELLQVLRAFRDGFMLKMEGGKKLVQYYYKNAPGYVLAIDARKDAKRIYRRMLTCFIIPAVNCVLNKKHGEALAIYARLVDYARVKAEGDKTNV